MSRNNVPLQVAIGKGIFRGHITTRAKDAYSTNFTVPDTGEQRKLAEIEPIFLLRATCRINSAKANRWWLEKKNAFNLATSKLQEELARKLTCIGLFLTAQDSIQILHLVYLALCIHFAIGTKNIYFRVFVLICKHNKYNSRKEKI